MSIVNGNTLQEAVKQFAYCFQYLMSLPLIDNMTIGDVVIGAIVICLLWKFITGILE